MQQLLLRWNQGQDLRQALITIAVSLIVADQVIAHFPRHVPEGTKAFGGNAVGIGWPGWTNRLVDLHVWGVQYSLARLVMLGARGRGRRRALALALPDEDRHGDPRGCRRPADDLGARDQHPGDVRDRVRRRRRPRRARGDRRHLAGQHLAGPGRRLAAQLARRGDHRRHGVAASAPSPGRCSSASSPRSRPRTCPCRAPDCCTQYSPVLTFVLMALVLAFRPRGLFGREA